jgi:peptide-methionine (R)-S-oxide reductase
MFYLAIIIAATCARIDDAKIVQTAAEWKETLGEARYVVLRQKGREPAYAGKYVNHWEKGVYVCAGCSLWIFSSDDKYDAGNGWASFKKPAEKIRVHYAEDKRMPFKRYEVLCRGCDGHLGHVFPDGPPPLGRRFCIHSASLKFLTHPLICK